MPKQFHPNKRGAHRVACIALYRALLSKCLLIEISPSLHRGRIHPIQEIIRKQFRRNAGVESPRLVVAALKVGYEADELLHTASCGDKAAHSKIIQLLREVQAQGIKDRARKEWFPDPPPQPKLRRPEPYPDATPMLEQRPRPKAEIVGIRHVPKLTGANAIPFLRFKKPQSPFLTRVLNDKAQQRQKRRDAVDEMEDLISFGWAEQEWDVKTGMTDETKWHMATELESTRVAQQLLTADRANGVLAKRMLAVVDEEQRLADLEKRARMKDKRRARRRSKGKGGDHEEGLLSSEGDQEGHVESQPHGESPVFKSDIQGIFSLVMEAN